MIRFFTFLGMAGFACLGHAQTFGGLTATPTANSGLRLDSAPSLADGVAETTTSTSLPSAPAADVFAAVPLVQAPTPSKGSAPKAKVASAATTVEAAPVPQAPGIPGFLLPLGLVVSSATAGSLARYASRRRSAYPTLKSSRV